MKTEPKVLEEGESTYRNGGGGSICGGVVSESLFMSDPWAYMMAWRMADDKFEEYKKADEKQRKVLFKKYAKSAI